MKIEKINENQIRCTLTHADLAERHLKLSELAYGTEKAKSLFRDMMQQASFDFGFEADDIPLMIEAIPASAGSIVLIITKVEDPEELDTRFSRFTSGNEGDIPLPEPASMLEGADEIRDLISKVKEAASAVSAPAETIPQQLHVKLFSFDNLDRVIEAARLIVPAYNGANTLYHDTEEDAYILALTPSEHTNNEFSKICNMLSEYGAPEKVTPAILAFLEEHCEIVVSSDSVQKLAAI